MLEPPSFSGVSETLLIPLAARGLARQRAPWLRFSDPEAERLTALFGERLAVHGADALTLRGVVRREQWFDAVVLAFARRHPDGLVVDLGCGLNTGQGRLAERLPARLRWLNVDLPPVIATRQSLLIEAPGAISLAADLTGEAWIDAVAAAREGSPCLFLAQGLLMYFEPAQAEALIRRLAVAFPGARLAFDYCSPLMARLGRRQPALRRGAPAKRPGSPFRWALARAADLGEQVPGLRVLHECDPSPKIGLLPAVLAGLHWRLTGGRLFYGLAEVAFPAATTGHGLPAAQGL